MAVFIPIFFMAVAGLYVQQTLDFDDIDSVKYPYAIAVALVGLSLAILAVEIRRRLAPGGPAFDKPSPAASSGRAWNPLFLVIVTVAFAAVLPTIKTMAALFLFITALRLIFRTLSIKGLLLDAVAIVVIYLVFHDILLILLPAGPVEEWLSALVRNALR